MLTSTTMPTKFAFDYFPIFLSLSSFLSLAFTSNVLFNVLGLPNRLQAVSRNSKFSLQLFCHEIHPQTESKSFECLVHLSPALYLFSVSIDGFPFLVGARQITHSLSPIPVSSVSENTDASITKRSFISVETVCKLSFYVVPVFCN